MFGLKKLERKAKGLILLVLTGGIGVGGYTYRDHPIVRQLLGRAKQEAEDNGIDVAKVKDEAKELVKSLAATVEAKVGAVERKVGDRADLARPGTFEVDVAAIRVDPAEFHAGRSAELDVHVTCHQKGGRDTVVWKGKATARANADSDGLLELGWTQHPFRVD